MSSFKAGGSRFLGFLASTAVLLLLGACPGTLASGGLPGGQDLAGSLPGAPTGLRLTNVDATIVRLDWADGSDNESGFRISRYSFLSGMFTSIEVAQPDQVTYVDSGLTAGIEYGYKVRAYNSKGESAETAQVSIHAGVPVAAPGELAVTATTSTSVSLSWRQNSAKLASFQIERSPSSDPGGFVQIDSATSCTYTDSTCSASTRYWYRVRQLSPGWVLSDYSSLVSALTLESLGPPSSLTLAAGAASISLSWTPSPTPGATYTVLRRSEGYSYASAIQSGLAATTYTDASATPGFLYYYSVKAVLGSDSSAATSERSGSIVYVYRESEPNGPTTWASDLWYYSGNSILAKKVFEIIGGYSGANAIYNPYMYEKYDYDVFKISLAKDDKITLRINSGNVNSMSGLGVSVCWVDSSDIEGAHAFTSSGGTYSLWLNYGLTVTEAYIKVSIPTSATGTNYDLSFTVTR